MSDLFSSAKAIAAPQVRRTGELLDAALKLLQAGKPIFPVNFDRRPYIQWKEFQTRLPEHRGNSNLVESVAGGKYRDGYW
jgi:hypothetical protein